ncbi:MAG: peptidyl-prolyl cis-trans isomerase [Novosphingobium sp.]|nr:peptidyl-prolyl cis-trans isomerase [Novosphingobium sp.]MCP5403608.1 peptidyl-prolyl cis-trans isomerase [Novosphingobium sp.]
MAFLKRIARVDPLVLFLIAGLALYLVLDAAGLVRGNDRVIVVDEARLSAFMASQGGRDPGGKASLLDAAERRELIAAYVRDEALYREALALGLDREDSAIRRRLVQSLRFSLQDEGNDEATAGKPSDAELRAFFESHRDRFLESPTVSFSHVFFDKRRRGTGAAQSAAREAKPMAATGDWLAMGDRYPYQRSQTGVTEATLAAELGEEAAQRIFALDAESGRWQGPVESGLGFHLVRIERKTAGGVPEFDDIRPALAEQWAREQREQALDGAIDRIVGEYRVSIAPGLGVPSK